MKALKLILTSVLLLAANAAFASGASVTNASVSGYGSGTALLVVAGSNGSVSINKTGTTYTGSVTSVSTVQSVAYVVMVSQPSASTMCNTQCNLTIPDGATASATFTTSLPSTSGGALSIRVGSVSYTATSGSTHSQTVSLSPGTYALGVYGSEGSIGTGIVGQLNVSITYEE